MAAFLRFPLRRRDPFILESARLSLCPLFQHPLEKTVKRIAIPIPLLPLGQGRIAVSPGALLNSLDAGNLENDSLGEITEFMVSR